MNSREILVWLAGIISADGNIARSKQCKSCAVSIASVEKDWINLIKNKTRKTGLHANVIRHKNKYNYYEIRLSPARMVYLKLSDVKEYVMPRKFKILEIAYGDVQDIKNRIECYQKAMSLRKGKRSGIYQRIKKLSKKYSIPANTIEFWIYNHQVPNVLRVGVNKGGQN